MTTAVSVLGALGKAGIKLDIVGDRLRLTGNLTALTDDLRGALRNHKPAILAMWTVPTYPNSEGLVKCAFCIRLDGYRCTRGHHPDGIALLRECSDFSGGIRT